MLAKELSDCCQGHGFELQCCLAVGVNSPSISPFLDLQMVAVVLEPFEREIQCPLTHASVRTHILPLAGSSGTEKKRYRTVTGVQVMHTSWGPLPSTMQNLLLP